jgi:competence protein ComEC
VMPFYDRSIDVVIATHADQDHVGGLPDVLKNYKVNIFMEPGVPGQSSSYDELEKRVSGSGIKKILARRGMDIDLGDGAVLQILFPVIDPPGSDTNMSSIVAKLVYEKNEFMLTGDAPISTEHYLLSLGTADLKSDVLKAGHHGSKTSSSAKFVSAVSPQYAVISVGKDNKYGHPNQEVLDIFNNFGAKILQTDELGQIVFKSDGANLSLK